MGRDHDRGAHRSHLLDRRDQCLLTLLVGSRTNAERAVDVSTTGFGWAAEGRQPQSLTPDERATGGDAATQSALHPLPDLLALGLGLTLFVTLALTDQTISKELRAGIPEKAPAFFFLDVRNEQLPAFVEAARKFDGVQEVANAPMLRGRIARIGDTPAEKVKTGGDSSWALRGDRGLTAGCGVGVCQVLSDPRLAFRHRLTFS